jgi:hypothetical protein
MRLKASYQTCHARTDQQERITFHHCAMDYKDDATHPLTPEGASRPGPFWDVNPAASYHATGAGYELDFQEASQREYILKMLYWISRVTTRAARDVPRGAGGALATGISSNTLVRGNSFVVE